MPCGIWKHSASPIPRSLISKLSHAVNDEFFCNYIYDLTEEMLQKTLPLAEGSIALQDKQQTYDSDRTRIYREKEDSIKKILAECPTEQELRRWLHRIQLEETLFDTTYTKAEIADTVCWAKDLKDRHSILWLYYNLFGTEPV